MPFNIKENFKGKKLTKISVHLHKISEREDAIGTYTFEDGTTKEGGAYLNNVLSGTIDFPNEDGNFKDFTERLKDNEWTQYIRQFIDNFSGEGKSIDYEEDEFENWEHIDTSDCEYDANKEPTDIYLYFGDEEIQFNLNNENLYEFKDSKYSKNDIIELVKHFNK